METDLRKLLRKAINRCQVKQKREESDYVFRNLVAAEEAFKILLEILDEEIENDE